jgi:hypothetical protein
LSSTERVERAVARNATRRVVLQLAAVRRVVVRRVTQFVRVSVAVGPLLRGSPTVHTWMRTGRAQLACDPAMRRVVAALTMPVEPWADLAEPLPLCVVAGAPPRLPHRLVTTLNRALTLVPLALQWGQRVPRTGQTRSVSRAVPAGILRPIATLDHAARTTVRTVVVRDRRDGCGPVDRFPAALTGSASLSHIGLSLRSVTPPDGCTRRGGSC